MKSFRTTTTETTTMLCWNNSSQFRMPIRRSKDSSENMESWMRKNRSSSEPTIQSSPKTITPYWDFQETLLWMRSREPIENFLWSITQKIIQTVNKPISDSLMSMKLTMPYQITSTGELTMMFFLDKSNHSELMPYSMISSATNFSNSLKKTKSLGLSSTDHGERDWTTWWILSKILGKFKMVSL